jgi:hypothetical protein
VIASLWPSGSTLAAASNGVDDVGQMTPRAHAFVLAAAALCIFVILRLVRRHGLRSKYSLLWLTMSVPLAALGLFPGLLVAAARLVGIHYPPATFLAVAVGFLVLVVIHFSWELSRLEERTRILAETTALLDARIERLQAMVPGTEGDSEEREASPDLRPAPLGYGPVEPPRDVSTAHQHRS